MRGMLGCMRGLHRHRGDLQRLRDWLLSGEVGPIECADELARRAAAEMRCSVDRAWWHLAVLGFGRRTDGSLIVPSDVR